MFGTGTRAVHAVAALVALGGTSFLPAANRITVESIEVPVGATQEELSIELESDQDLLGFSIHLQYDTSKVEVRELSLGSDVAPLEPEFSDGSIDNTAGRVNWAVVFDFSGPDISKQLDGGANYEALVLTLDVVASEETSATLDLRNVSSSEPRRLNVITDTNGDSVSPSLVDGSVDVVDLRPAITGYSENEGEAGKVFFINGENFDQSGTAVSVCGVDAEFELIEPGDTLQVTAPECSPGPAEVEVCNDFGCDADPQGFSYPQPPGGPVIENFQLNSGQAGDHFFVVGQDFDQPGLSVEVCGTAAEFELLADGQSIDVTAPPCDSTGPARVEVCTDLGCDFDNAGFVYEGTAGPQFRRGDTNGDGARDVTDGVVTLGFLFLGQEEPPCMDAADANDTGKVDIGDAIFTFGYLFLGGDPIPPPLESCGEDPTDDPLDCADPPSDC